MFFRQKDFDLPSHGCALSDCPIQPSWQQTFGFPRLADNSMWKSQECVRLIAERNAGKVRVVGEGGRKQADPSNRKSNILSNIDNSIFNSLRLPLSLCLLRGVHREAGCWLRADARSFLWSFSLPWTLTLFWAGDSGDQQDGIREGQILPHILQRLSLDFTFKTQFGIKLQKTQWPGRSQLAGTIRRWNTLWQRVSERRLSLCPGDGRVLKKEQA